MSSQQPPPGATLGYTAMASSSEGIKRRNPALVWLVWPFLTLGIYHFVWLYSTQEEINRTYRFKEPVSGWWPVCAHLFGWVTFGIWTLISVYNKGDYIARAQRKAGLAATCSGGIGLGLSFLFGLHALYYQSELNKLTPLED